MYAAPPPDWVVDSDRNVRWRNNVTSANDKDLKSGDTYIGKTGYYKSEMGYTIQLHNKEALAAGERSWDYYVPNNRYEQEPDAQIVQTEIGNGNGDLATLSNENKKGIDVGSIGVAVSEGIIERGVRTIENGAKDLGLAQKTLGALGKFTGAVSAINDFNNISNKGFSNATWADWTKFGISTGSLLLKSNPYTIGFGIIYGIADVSGYNPVDLVHKSLK